MELAWGPEEKAFGQELNAFLDARTPPELAKGYDFMGDFDDDDAAVSSRSGCATGRRRSSTTAGWCRRTRRNSAAATARPCRRSSTSRRWRRRRILRSGHFPGYAIVAPSLLEFGTDEQKELAPAAIRGDTIWCIGMSEPNAGSDLAGLQTRADVFDDHFVVNGQKVWTSYAIDRPAVLLLRPHRPAGTEAQGDLAAHRRHGHNGDRGAAAAPPQRQGRLRRGVLRRRRGARENLVGQLHGGWVLTQGSLAHERAGLWVEGVARLEQSIDALVDTRRSAPGEANDPIVRRKIAAAYETRREPARARVQGVRLVRAGVVRARALVHEARDVRGREGGVRTRHGGRSAGSARWSTTSVGVENGRFAHGFFSSFANTIAGGIVRDPAQHHRPARARAPEGVTVDFSLTDDQQLLRDTARNLLAKRMPAGARYARTSTTRRLPRRCGTTCARTPRSAAAPRTDLCLFLQETATSPRRDRSSRRPPCSHPCSRRSGTTARCGPAGTASGTVAIAGAEGVWQPNDDPTKMFVLEADRVDYLAVITGTCDVAIVPRPPADRLRFVETLDPSRRMFAVDVDREQIDARAAPRARPRWPAPSTLRTSRSPRRWSGPRSASSTWRSPTRRCAYQFDRPIGSFQAIQHKLADTALALERATAAVQYAAMTVDADDAERTRACHVAKAAAGEAGPARPEGRRPGPRRHRVHVGARPAPLPAPRDRRRVPARHHRLAPRSPRRPANRLIG